MQSKLAKQIKESIVLPAMNEKPANLIASVVDVNHEHMMCSISTENTTGPGIKVFKNATIQLGGNGMSQSGPYIGDKVMVEFPNGNVHRPVVTAILDTNHKITTREQKLKHEGQGAYCPDIICERDDWEYESTLWKEVMF